MWQRDVHDHRVQHHHQLRGGDYDQRQAEAAVSGAGRTGCGHSALVTFPGRKGPAAIQFTTGTAGATSWGQA